MRAEHSILNDKNWRGRREYNLRAYLKIKNMDHKKYDIKIKNINNM